MKNQHLTTPNITAVQNYVNGVVFFFHPAHRAHNWLTRTISIFFVLSFSLLIVSIATPYFYELSEGYRQYKLQVLKIESAERVKLAQIAADKVNNANKYAMQTAAAQARAITDSSAQEREARLNELRAKLNAEVAINAAQNDPMSGLLKSAGNFILAVIVVVVLMVGFWQYALVLGGLALGFYMFFG